ncbi:hypothetical protein GMSM_39530 [Geomonas sp. Red276]
MHQLENIKFGLMLACGVLFVIFLFFATYYTLYEISLNETLEKPKKLRWSALTLLLPGIGAISYHLLAPKNR